MSSSAAALVELVAMMSVVLGVVGLVAPVLPGTPLIWIGAFGWAWADDFRHVGWPTLVVLGILAVAAEVADIVVTTWAARRSGVPFASVCVAGLCSLAGAVVFSLPGAIAGAGAGIFLAERRRLGGDGQRALASARALAAAYLASMALQIVMGGTMVALFFWQAAAPP